MKAMNQAIIPLIRKITPFNLLPNEALGEVALRITEKRVSKGEMLYSQNHSKLKFLDILVSGNWKSSAMTNFLLFFVCKQ